MTGLLNETQSGTIAGACVGLVLWVLSTYVFKGGVPGPVSAFVYIVLPALVAGAVGYLTRKSAKKPG